MTYQQTNFTKTQIEALNYIDFDRDCVHVSYHANGYNRGLRTFLVYLSANSMKSLYNQSLVCEDGRLTMRGLCAFHRFLQDSNRHDDAAEIAEYIELLRELEVEDG